MFDILPFMFTGTEEALTFDAKAVEALRRLSWLMNGHDDSGGNEDHKNKRLTAFHQCRDKQVFRILSTIADSSHSSNARQRAMEQVPSRVKAFLGDGTVATFALRLLEQTAMPDFMNFSVFNHVVQMGSQHRQLRLPAFDIILMLSRPFPRMAEPAWNPLTELVQMGSCSNKKQRTSDKTTARLDEANLDDELLDLTTAILATSARFSSPTDTIPERLVELCRHGTTQQARNSVKAIVAFRERNKETHRDEEDDATDPLCLMDSLSSDLSLTKTTQTLTILAALTALVDSAPDNSELMESASHDTWRFCLKVLDKDIEKHSASPRRKRGRSATSREIGTESLVCAAIDFLVTFLRAFSFASSNTDQKSFVTTHRKDIQKIFSRLVKFSGSSAKSETLREHSALRLCQLCDPRVRLEPTFLTTDLWFAFSKVLIDDSPVRESIAQEFVLFLTGGGLYGDEASPRCAEAPSLRIVSLHMLLQTKQTKVAVTQSIMFLRNTCDKAYAQCRALGEEAVEKFESAHKMRLMPEYMVPFAIYLLAFHVDENDGRLLRRRLKQLMEPLVQSLGESADNISFLLRMVEYLGENFEVAPPNPLSEADCSLRTICKAAREVLLAMVKKDVNLSPYPGQIHVPAWLFKRKAKQIQLSQSTEDSTGPVREVSIPAIKNRTPRYSSMKKRDPDERHRRTTDRHVQFSPDSVLPRHEIQPPKSNTREEKDSFGDISPIANDSPDERKELTAVKQSTDTPAKKEVMKTAPSRIPPLSNQLTPASRQSVAAETKGIDLSSSFASVSHDNASFPNGDSVILKAGSSKKRSHGYTKEDTKAKRKRSSKKVPVQIKLQRGNALSRNSKQTDNEASTLDFEAENEENIVNTDKQANAKRSRKTGSNKSATATRVLRSRDSKI